MQNNYSPKNRNKQSALDSINSDKSLKNSRSRVSHINKKHKIVRGEDYDPNDNIRMINQSMIQLQDPKFISEEIDEFESRLPSGPSAKGFCKISRQMSLMLSNTQGYRKYKNQNQLKQKDNRINKSQQKNTIETPPIAVQTPKKQGSKQKQLDKKSSKSKSISSQSQSQQSLNYSSDSRERRSRKQLKKQSIQSVDNNSNLTNNSLDFYKSEIRVQQSGNIQAQQSDNIQASQQKMPKNTNLNNQNLP